MGGSKEKTRERDERNRSNNERNGGKGWRRTLKTWDREKYEGGKGRTGKHGTKSQGWKTHN